MAQAKRLEQSISAITARCYQANEDAF